jgi:hypothetical protein
VQGLSRENIHDEDEDDDMMLGDRKEGQMGDFNHQKMDIGLVKCPMLHKPEIGGQSQAEPMDVVKVPYEVSKDIDKEGDMKLELAIDDLGAGKECQEIRITEKQKLPDTRQSGRMHD